MRKVLIMFTVLFLTACTKNEIAQHLKHTKAEGNSPVLGAVYVGTALVVGDVLDSCSHGHPEDQIKCKRAKEKVTQKNK